MKSALKFIDVLYLVLDRALKTALDFVWFITRQQLGVELGQLHLKVCWMFSLFQIALEGYVHFLAVVSDAALFWDQLRVIGYWTLVPHQECSLFHGAFSHHVEVCAVQHFWSRIRAGQIGFEPNRFFSVFDPISRPLLAVDGADWLVPVVLFYKICKLSPGDFEPVPALVEFVLVGFAISAQGWWMRIFDNAGDDFLFLNLAMLTSTICKFVFLVHRGRIWIVFYYGSFCSLFY